MAPLDPWNLSSPDDDSMDHDVGPSAAQLCSNYTAPSDNLPHPEPPPSSSPIITQVGEDQRRTIGRPSSFFYHSFFSILPILLAFFSFSITLAASETSWLEFGKMAVSRSLAAWGIFLAGWYVLRRCIIALSELWPASRGGWIFLHGAWSMHVARRLERLSWRLNRLTRGVSRINARTPRRDFGSYVDRYIHDKAAKRASECPIRLYDMAMDCFVTRGELSKEIEDEIRLLADGRHGSSRSTLEPNEYITIQSDAVRLSQYAILSHTWTAQELTYEDASNGYHLHAHKFQGLCKVAKEYGCRYIWIDTACIDKSSSSELDESIRSMYEWYKNAFVCFVYLSTTPMRDWQVDPWFVRGWTLQELLAPVRMVFYTSEWERLFRLSPRYDVVRMERLPFDLFCSWDEEPLVFYEDDNQTDPIVLQEIAHISGVSVDDMKAYTPSPQHATRMFRYMGERETTRPEDLAYCLLGLLDISLSISYGEGEAKALERLQVACANACGDRGLFLWNPVYNGPSPHNSMLPHNPYISKRPAVSISPESLWNSCGNTNDNFSTVDPSFSFTNCGLRIAVTLHDINLTETTLQLRNLPETDIVVRSNRYGDVDYTHESKLAVLGASDDDKATPFAIVLQKFGNGRVPRYRRLPVHITAKTLPPMSILAAHPPEIVLIV